MLDIATAPYGILLLRVALGGLFLAHAYLKLFVFKPSGTVGFFNSIGLPGWFAYFTIAAEIIGGIALIVGFWPRLAALALVPILLGTIVKVHGKAGFYFDRPNGGWEYPAFWALSLLVLALLGDGAAAIATTPLFGS